MNTRYRRYVSGVLAWLGLLAPISNSYAQMSFEDAFPHLTFDQAVDIQNAGDGSNRLFVAELPGIIRVVPADPSATAAPIFLDVRDRVLSNDRFGFLGFVFHPDFEMNGYFFVHYTVPNPDRSVIARYAVSASDPNVADRDSEVVLLEVEQPHKFHNGGQLAFGPDGYLYIIFGDGGFSGDPSGHGQNRQTLLGNMLRIDVDTPSGDKPYSIPPDNPFVGNTEGFHEEIWAWGFRNPWRFSIDPVTGWLWSADNGEDNYEEIALVEKGQNHGWKIREGQSCFSPTINCTTDGLTDPIFAYGGDSGRRSVIGGYVYRGQQNPELRGMYIYGDHVIGRIWALDYDGSAPPVQQQVVLSAPQLATFGLDEQGEIYWSSLFDRKLFRFRPTATSTDAVTQPVRLHLEQSYPNPFNPRVTVAFSLEETSSLTLDVFDVYGRQVARVLDDAQRSQGRHTIAIDGAMWTSGTYFYRLTARSITGHTASQMQTMTLIK